MVFINVLYGNCRFWTVFFDKYELKISFKLVKWS